MLAHSLFQYSSFFIFEFSSHLPSLTSHSLHLSICLCTGNTTGPGARDPSLAMAGDTIAALTSILKDKVNSTENVAMSSMFAMLQQQQQQSKLFVCIYMQAKVSGRNDYALVNNFD